MALFSWQYNSQHNSTLAVWYFPDFKLSLPVCVVFCSPAQRTQCRQENTQGSKKLMFDILAEIGPSTI